MSATNGKPPGRPPYRHNKTALPEPGDAIVSAPASCAHSSAARSAAKLLLTGSRCHFGELVILIEKKLLPPSLDEAQRTAAMRAWMHQRRGGNGHVVAVVRGQEGWVRQLGNDDGVVHYAVIERRCRPALPQRTHRRMSW